MGDQTLGLPGYSWLTNQYGLALDSVRAFELVLPNGTVTNVNEATHPDLFWGLKVRVCHSYLGIPV